MKNFTIIILSLFILLVSFVILLKNYEDQTVGVIIDNLEINKANLLECCKYFVDNKEKTCSVLINYSCDLCSNKCYNKSK